MKSYQFFHPLYLSFSSKRLYQDVGQRWKGLSFGYLFFLQTICLIALMLNFQFGLANVIDQYAPGIISQIPVITISNGRVSTPEYRPYFIKFPDNSEIIIDTTGQYFSLEQTQAQALLTTTHLIVRRNPQEVRTYNLSSLDNLQIEQNLLKQWLDWLKSWAVFIVYPFALIYFFIYRIIQVLFYALIGMIFAKSMKVNLSYASLVRLSAIAITPVLVLEVLFRIFGNPLFGGGNLVGFLIVLGYLFYGVKVNSNLVNFRETTD